MREWKSIREPGWASHMHIHHMNEHKGAEKPEFIVRAAKYPKTALSRQLGEAVRIRRRRSWEHPQQQIWIRQKQDSQPVGWSSKIFIMALVRQKIQHFLKHPFLLCSFWIHPLNTWCHDLAYIPLPSHERRSRLYINFNLQMNFERRMKGFCS